MTLTQLDVLVAYTCNFGCDAVVQSNLHRGL